MSAATCGLAAEVVEEDAFSFDSKVVEHFQDRLHHHGRSAHEILAILRRLVRPEIIVIERLVNEPAEPSPVILRKRIVEREVEREVRMFLLQLFEFLDVKRFA